MKHSLALIIREIKTEVRWELMIQGIAENLQGDESRQGHQEVGIRAGGRNRKRKRKREVDQETDKAKGYRQEIENRKWRMQISGI